jgi:hypothetical protein
MTDIGMDERRKPGRPRKFGQGRINATVRFTPKTYAALKTAADDNRRSVSEEVETRIEHAIRVEPLLEIGRGIDRIGEELQEIAQELLEKYMARVDELEARNAELQKKQALTEEMIERAVSRALAKTRLTIGIGDDAAEGAVT